MIRSMTGFGRGEAGQNGHNATVELSSVNSRYLELQFRLPRELNALEPRLRETLSESFSRGKIYCTVVWEAAPGAAGRVELNEPLAEMYQEVFRQLKERFDPTGEVRIQDFAGLPDIFTFVPTQIEPELVEEIVVSALTQAATALKTLRSAEGEKILVDLSARVKTIFAQLIKIESDMTGHIERYREKLQQRVEELFGDSGYDPQRLAEEVAYLAERSDITEECVRLKIHTGHFEEALSGDGGPVGRRLNFLVQEMNREANTIGSKAGSADISTYVVTIKEELEKIREQIQNIE